MKQVKHNGVTLDIKRQKKGQLKHNKLVKENGMKLTNEVNRRLRIHDKDKLEHLDMWARFQIVTKSGFKFGSDEYNNLIKTLDIHHVLINHRTQNPHHPEHFDNDFTKMSLIDLTELAADWYTANSTRPSGTEFSEMLNYQQGVYKFSDDIKSILFNTFQFLKKSE